MTEKEKETRRRTLRWEQWNICANTSRLVPPRGKKIRRCHHCSKSLVEYMYKRGVRVRARTVFKTKEKHRYQATAGVFHGLLLSLIFSFFFFLLFFLFFFLNVLLRLSVQFSYPPWIGLFYSRGFSARTRRRGSIIHHTNSPEAGERAGWHAGTRQRHTFLSWRALLGETHAAHHHRHTADRSRFSS